MVDVAAALLWCKLGLPKGLDSFNKLLFIRRFDSVCQVVFQVTTNSLYWIKIRGFSQSAPPVYAIVIKKFFSFAAGVLGIIILLKLMVVWILDCLNGRRPTLRIFT